MRNSRVRRELAREVFFRGLSIGALVGAAIAGSAIWERWRRRRHGRDAST